MIIAPVIVASLTPLLTEGRSAARILTTLTTLVESDQRERHAYSAYLHKYKNDWHEAVAAWCKDKHRQPHDVFLDSQRTPAAKQLIGTNLKLIAANSTMSHLAWLLVQHMDADVSFQRQYLKVLTRGTEDYKYLYDRIAINTGQPQQYHTQNNPKF